jgi:hypothetical protein
MLLFDMLCLKHKTPDRLQLGHRIVMGSTSHHLFAEGQSALNSLLAILKAMGLRLAVQPLAVSAVPTA